MSIWIFDRRLIKTISLVALAGLAACTSSRLGTGTSNTSANASAQKSKITVSGRNLVVEGPQGFCIDRQVSQISRENAFVLLANCRVVSPKSRAPAPKVKALLTATFSGAGQGGSSVVDSLVSMDRFFRSETGRTALSRDSDPETVEILDTFHSDDTFFLRARDTSKGIVPGATDDYWRAYFDLHDQIVSVSVIGFKTDPISPSTGLDTTREFAYLIRERNGVAAAPVIPAEQVEDTVVAEDTEPTRQKRKRRVRDPMATFWTIGLLRRLVK